MRIAILVMVLLSAGCDRLLQQRPDLTLPDSSEAAAIFAAHGIQADFRYSGNVLELVVEQPSDQLRRGGPLWARVGPYIYVFSPGTRQLFERYPGVAAVRAITMTGQTEVARAMLVRDTMNEYDWRRARAAVAQALESGTARPGLMDRLVQFGEQHTQYEYNPRFVPPR
jgi:hypothetical protein